LKTAGRHADGLRTGSFTISNGLNGNYYENITLEKMINVYIGKKIKYMASQA